jgi:hypothetical protein
MKNKMTQILDFIRLKINSEDEMWKVYEVVTPSLLEELWRIECEMISPTPPRMVELERLIKTTYTKGYRQWKRRNR